jgi:hypothetical protein
LECAGRGGGKRLENGRDLDFNADSTWHAGTLVRMEQSGFRPEDENNYQGANYGWQRYFGGLERMAAGLD